MMIKSHDGYIQLIGELNTNPNKRNIERSIVVITELFEFYQTNKELRSRYRHLLVEAMQIATENKKLEKELQEFKDEHCHK